MKGDPDDYIKIFPLQKGEKLYHYTNATAVRGIIDSNSFWATKYDFLNDRSEFEYAYKLFSEKIISEIKDVRLKKEIRTRLRKEINDDFSVKIGSVLNGYYVLSFSLNADNLALWSEFTNEAGYCIEFDYAELDQTLETYFGWEGKVVYDREIQLQNMRDNWSEFLEQEFGIRYSDILENANLDLQEKTISGMVLHALILCVLYGMFYKKPEFGMEQEYRYVFSVWHDGNGKRDLPMQFRIKGDTFVPYVIIPCNARDAIKSIEIGPKNNMDIAEKGVSLYCLSKGLDIKIKKSKVSLRY